MAERRQRQLADVLQRDVGATVRSPAAAAWKMKTASALPPPLSVSGTGPLIRIEPVEL